MSSITTTPLTFRARTKVAYAVEILGVAATVASAWAVARGHVGWGWPVGCGLFAILLIPSLLKLRSLYLRLDEDGLEMDARYMDKVRVRWSEVEQIEVLKSDDDSRTRRAAIKIVYATPARNELLIENAFSSPLDEIVRTLDTWRHRHAYKQET